MLLVRTWACELLGSEQDPTLESPCLVIIFIPEKTKYYWLGLFIGTMLGTLTVLYMVWNKVIDPEAAKLTYRERVESPWIIISVVGGMIIARMLFRFIPSRLEVLLICAVLSWITLTFGYLAFKVWRND